MARSFPGRSTRACLAACFAVLTVIAAAPPAGAVPVTTVTPTTGLLDGQMVDIVLTGHTSGESLIIVECGPGNTIDACDPTTAVYRTTDTSGSVSASTNVVAIARGATAAVDCRAATPPNLCHIEVLRYGSGGPELVSSVDIAFDPAGALLPPPLLTATPATGLVDGQVVALNGSGYRPNQYVNIYVCPTGASSSSNCANYSFGTSSTTDASGNLDTTLTAHPLIYSNTYTATDCRVAGACEAVVFSGGLGGAPATAPLTFDPSAALPPQPTLVPSPATGLVDHQHVLATGTGYGSSMGVSVYQCSATVCQHIGEGTSASDGSIAVDVVIEALITDYSGTDTTDCRLASACRLVVAPWNSQTSVGVAALAFDPLAPLAPPPDVAVSPATDLLDGQVVTLTGDGFATSNNQTLLVSQCVAGDTTGNACDYSTQHYNIAVDPTGAISSPLQVYAIISALNQTIDCRVTTCELRAQISGNARQRASALLAFDPAGPLAPPPIVSVTPSTNLSDGQTVHVHATGVRSNSYWAILECHGTGLAVPDPTRCAYNAAQGVSPDPTGMIDFDVIAEAVITVADTTTGPPGTTPVGSVPGTGPSTTSVTGTTTVGTPSTHTVDCRTAPGGCSIALTNQLYGGPGAPYFSSVPISFDPNAIGQRYADRVFPSVDITRDISYGHAIGQNGDEDLKLDLYEPHGDTLAERPVIMYIHGGYFSGGDKSEAQQVGTELARRGYVVVSINYRLYNGGDPVSHFARAIPAAWHDAQAAVRFVRANAAAWRVSTRAIASMGYSAGAITSVNLAYMSTDETGDNASNPGYPSNIVAAVSLSGSAVQVTPNAPPLRMFHGDDDTTVLYASAVSTCENSRAMGNYCELTTYPGIGHGIYNAYSDWMPKMAQFYLETVIPQLAAPVSPVDPVPPAPADPVPADPAFAG